MLLPSSHSSPRLACNMPSPQPAPETPARLAPAPPLPPRPPITKPLEEPALAAAPPPPPLALAPVPELPPAPAPPAPVGLAALQLMIRAHPTVNAHQRLNFSISIGKPLEKAP